MEDIAGGGATGAAARLHSGKGRRASKPSSSAKPALAPPQANVAGAEGGGPPEMVTPVVRASLTKQGYKIIGSHSGVKLCRWTKVSVHSVVCWRWRLASRGFPVRGERVLCCARAVDAAWPWRLLQAHLLRH